ncbi:putative protein phosphatase 2C 61 [Polypedilum vanderplanki]|uniref:protein-serine/threonine phosphatase n=1 Tax=Polypedilum vanderplanki TaxID=319348 RepID=A0A9J6BUX5_POLVA|nr:putative protein phosphatase 2C 61 [Polypedilum vanderplanki]
MILVSMGSYLDKPETTKKSAFDENEFLEVGSSSMQGWRINQEDAHNSILNFNGENVSFFGLYDGHGGAEVADYCSRKLPEFLKQLQSFNDKDYENALKEAFMGFDAVLLKEDVIEELKQIAKSNPDYDASEPEDAEDEETAEEIIGLHEEANMSLSEVLKKYKNGTDANKAGKKSEARPVAGGSSSSQCPTSSSSSSTSSKPVKNNTDNEQTASHSSENQVTSSSSAEANPSPTSTQQVDEKLDDNEPQSSGSSSSSSAPLNGQIGSSTTSTANINSITSNAENAPESSSSAKPSKRERNLTDSADSTTEEDTDDDEEDKTFAAKLKKKQSQNTEESSDDDEDFEEEEVEDEEMSGEEEEDDEDHLDDMFMNTMETGPGKQSGCTAVVAVLDGCDLYVANAGDSRCVLCRNGRVIEMTADHKPEDDTEFQRIKKAGGRVTLDGRVNGGLNLSRAIGDHGYKNNKSLPPEEQMITAMPDLKKITLEPEDDFMILACDGIWNYMSNEEVVGFVKERINSNKSLTAICEELFDNCLAPNTLGDGTGCDNMTAIIVKFKDTIFKKGPAKVTCKRTFENENEVQSTESEPCDKKQKIDEEIAPSTVDTSN